MKSLNRALLALSVGVLAAPTAFAQAAKGDNIVVSEDPVLTKLASGKTYAFLLSHQLCTSADPKHPLNGASGDCSGACLSDAAGAATCMGSCTWVDAGGDLAFFTWDGQLSGGWKLMGGTGKWQGARGEGTWKGTAPTAGNVSHNAWEGTITLKR